MDENLSPTIKYWLTDADHDCFFIVGPENGLSEKIGVVKQILLAYSEPLRPLLKATSEGEQKVIRLNGVEPQTFRNFLKCLYGAADSVISSLSFEESAKLLYLIEKYSVNDFKPKIKSRLTELMSPDNIFLALSHPACFQVSDLKNEINAIFQNEMDKILSDKRFLSLSDATIMWIVQQELINVQDMKIWNAILKWSQHQIASASGKTIRPQIFQLLKNIHSSILEITEFCKDDNKVDDGVLLKDKVMESYRSFSRPPNVKKECKHTSYQHIATCNKISSGFMTSSSDAIIMSSIKIKEVGEKSEYTEWFEWCDYSWRILVAREKEGYNDSLGCFLSCKKIQRDTNTRWRCMATFEFILVNQHSGSNFSKSVQSKEFDEKGASWGYSTFYSWHSLAQNYNGFVKDGCILLMVRFTCNKP